MAGGERAVGEGDLGSHLQKGDREANRHVPGACRDSPMLRLDRWPAKRLDAEKWAQRFSPRKKKSHWTETNKALARRLIAEGRMTDAGRAALPQDMFEDGNGAGHR